MKRTVVVEVVAHFSFKTELDVSEDEEGLTSEEEDEIVDAVQMSLAAFRFRESRIEDPPAIDVNVPEGAT